MSKVVLSKFLLWFQWKLGNLCCLSSFSEWDVGFAVSRGQGRGHWWKETQDSCVWPGWSLVLKTTQSSAPRYNMLLRALCKHLKAQKNLGVLTYVYMTVSSLSSLVRELSTSAAVAQHQVGPRYRACCSAVGRLLPPCPLAGGNYRVLECW